MDTSRTGERGPRGDVQDVTATGHAEFDVDALDGPTALAQPWSPVLTASGTAKS